MDDQNKQAIDAMDALSNNISFGDVRVEEVSYGGCSLTIKGSYTEAALKQQDEELVDELFEILARNLEEHEDDEVAVTVGVSSVLETLDFLGINERVRTLLEERVNNNMDTYI